MLLLCGGEGLCTGWVKETGHAVPAAVPVYTECESDSDGALARAVSGTVGLLKNKFESGWWPPGYESIPMSDPMSFALGSCLEAVPRHTGSVAASPSPSVSAVIRKVRLPGHNVP